MFCVSHLQLIFKIPMNTPVLQLSWHGGRGTLAVVTEEGSVVLSESVLQAAMCGEVFVVQKNSHEVAVLTGGQTKPVSINTGEIL